MVQLHLDIPDILEVQGEAVKRLIVVQLATVAIGVFKTVEAVGPLKRGCPGVSPFLRRRKNAV